MTILSLSSAFLACAPLDRMLWSGLLLLRACCSGGDRSDKRYWGAY
jgi:hypothetical protein